MALVTKVFAVAVLFGVVGPSLARVYILDDGQPQFGDLVSSANAPRPRRGWSGLASKEESGVGLEAVEAETGAGGGPAGGERVRRDHHQGVTGPVHTFVKTDKHAHFKWGVRHHVGHEYAG